MKTLIYALNLVSGLRLYITRPDGSAVHDALHDTLQDIRSDVVSTVERHPKLADAAKYWDLFLERIDAYSQIPATSAEHSKILTTKVSEFVHHLERYGSNERLLRDIHNLIENHKPMTLWNFDDSCFFNALMQILLSFGDSLSSHLTAPASDAPEDVAFLLGLKNLFTDRYIEHKPISDVIAMRMLLPDFWLKDFKKLNPRNYPKLAKQVFSKIPFLNENAEVYILPYQWQHSLQDLGTLLDAHAAQGAELPLGKKWVFIYFESGTGYTDRVSLPETVEIKVAGNISKRYKLVGTINRYASQSHIDANVWQKDLDHWYHMDDAKATPVEYKYVNNGLSPPSTAVLEEM